MYLRHRNRVSDTGGAHVKKHSLTLIHGNELGLIAWYWVVSDADEPSFDLRELAKHLAKTCLLPLLAHFLSHSSWYWHR